MAINETARGNTQQTATRTIEAPAKDIFRVLTLPTRHSEFDGSGMVRADEKSQRIQQVGDSFVMNMHAESQGGDYQMENHVVAYDENKLVGWKPAPVGGHDSAEGIEIERVRDGHLLETALAAPTQPAHLFPPV